jgi:hypothetical protein
MTNHGKAKVMLNSLSSRVATAVAVLSVSLVSALPVRAHDAIATPAQPLGWKYPWSCCSSMDCRMLGDQAVSERPEGYVIGSTGEIVAYADKRVKNSPDGEYHWCAHQAGIDAGHTICLFVPPKGF